MGLRLFIITIIAAAVMWKLFSVFGRMQHVIKFVRGARRKDVTKKYVKFSQCRQIRHAWEKV
jgi:hypothetical protein